MTEPRVWAGGEHVFVLRLGELRALQERTQRGPDEIVARLANRTWWVDDALETVRLGLIGGGMDAGEARRVLASATETAPLTEFRALAFDVLCAALYPPVEEEEAPEAETPEKPTGATSRDAGPSATSTPQGS